MRKVIRGDPLVIPAATFNTFIDAARDFQERQRSTQRDAVREQRDTGIVLIRNESGADRERFDVLGIDGPIIRRIDNEDEFRQRVALRGVVPSSPHPGRFAILLEPAKDQAIVRACVDGVCQVRVRMNREWHNYAVAKSNKASMLESAPSGRARMLWIEPIAERADPQIAWTVVQLGISAPASLLPVRVSKVGGFAGDSNSPCAFIYDVWDFYDELLLDADRIGVGLTPRTRRASRGKYEWAHDGSSGPKLYGYGLALFFPDGTVELHSVVGERPIAEACP